MEKRVLLAIFLSFIVLYVFQALFVKPAPKPVSKTTPSEQSAVTTPAAPTEAPAPAAPAAVEPPSAATLVGDKEERDVRIETPNVIALFTNRGARLKSWRLKRFHDQQGEPLELVSHDFGDAQPLPFSLSVPDAALTKRLNSALFSVTGAPSADGDVATPSQLTFEYRDADGLRAVKQFRVSPTTYIVSFGATVTQGERALTPTIEWGPGLGDVE